MIRGLNRSKVLRFGLVSSGNRNTIEDPGSRAAKVTCFAVWIGARNSRTRFAVREFTAKPPQMPRFPGFTARSAAIRSTLGGRSRGNGVWCAGNRTAIGGPASKAAPGGPVELSPAPGAPAAFGGRYAGNHDFPYGNRGIIKNPGSGAAEVTCFIVRVGAEGSGKYIYIYIYMLGGTVKNPTANSGFWCTLFRKWCFFH